MRILSASLGQMRYSFHIRTFLINDMFLKAAIPTRTKSQPAMPVWFGRRLFMHSERITTRTTGY